MTKAYVIGTQRNQKAKQFINVCVCLRLTASTACWRMDVNLENILFFDWTNFSREDLENSSIFFFLLLPPRSRLEVSYNDPCNERINVSYKTVTLYRPRDFTGHKHNHCKQDVYKWDISSALWTRWHFPYQLPFITTRGRRTTGQRHAIRDQCIQMGQANTHISNWKQQ